jgi:hypothetical protein
LEAADIKASRVFQGAIHDERHKNN